MLVDEILSFTVFRLRFLGVRMHLFSLKVLSRVNCWVFYTHYSFRSIHIFHSRRCDVDPAGFSQSFSTVFNFNVEVFHFHLHDVVNKNLTWGFTHSSNNSIPSNFKCHRSGILVILSFKFIMQLRRM